MWSGCPPGFIFPKGQYASVASKTAELKVRIEPELLAEVNDLAVEMGSKSAVVREGIKALKERRQADAALDRLIAVAQRDEKRLGGRKPPKGRYRMK